MEQCGLHDGGICDGPDKPKNYFARSFVENKPEGMQLDAFGVLTKWIGFVMFICCKVLQPFHDVENKSLLGNYERGASRHIVSSTDMQLLLSHVDSLLPNDADTLTREGRVALATTVQSLVVRKWTQTSEAVMKTWLKHVKSPFDTFAVTRAEAIGRYPTRTWESIDEDDELYGHQLSGVALQFCDEIVSGTGTGLRQYNKGVLAAIARKINGCLNRHHDVFTADVMAETITFARLEMAKKYPAAKGKLITHPNITGYEYSPPKFPPS